MEEKYSAALVHYKDALSLSLNPPNLAMCELNYGITLSLLDRHNAALLHIYKAAYLYVELGDEGSCNLCNMYAAKSNMHLGRYEEALRGYKLYLTNESLLPLTERQKKYYNHMINEIEVKKHFKNIEDDGDLYIIGNEGY